ncbi:MAG: sugar phosphate isomerase/epimerase [Candidatus Azotimanducaceae bacterium]|jgi:sugar phosphate isomerase/epimerase
MKRQAVGATNRLVSLAAGVVQEFPPEQVVYAAAKAGFTAVGIWCDLATWTSERTAKVKQALLETGITALDIEVVWFRPGEALVEHDRVIEIAKAISAKNILCVSSETDIEETKKRFRHLCEQTTGSDIRVVLEFLAITEIDSLAKALEVVTEVGHPHGGILIDSLHLQRTGSTPQDVADIQPETLLPYLQICDASLTLADQSYAGVLEDAIHLRSLPGEGELPLEDLLRAVAPNLPISLEIRSRHLTEQYPTLQERANIVFDRTQKFLISLE